MRRQQGFTLIELLIVLAVLAILIGIVGLGVGNVREAAIRRAMWAELQTVDKAVDAWLLLHPPAPQDEIGSSAELAAALAELEGEELEAALEGSGLIGAGPAFRLDSSPGEGNGPQAYLKKATKYWYTWSDVSLPTQSILVWNDDDAPTICCAIAGCGAPNLDDWSCVLAE